MVGIKRKSKLVLTNGDGLILLHKPNLGTYKFLIKSNIVENAIKESFENSSIFFFIKKTVPYYINFL